METLWQIWLVGALLAGTDAGWAQASLHEPLREGDWDVYPELGGLKVRNVSLEEDRRRFAELPTLDRAALETVDFNSYSLAIARIEDHDDRPRIDLWEVLFQKMAQVWEPAYDGIRDRIWVKGAAAFADQTEIEDRLEQFYQSPFRARQEALRFTVGACTARYDETWARRILAAGSRERQNRILPWEDYSGYRPTTKIVDGVSVPSSWTVVRPEPAKSVTPARPSPASSRRGWLWLCAVAAILAAMGWAVFLATRKAKS